MTGPAPSTTELLDLVEPRVEAGQRFVGLFGTDGGDDLTLTAVLDAGDRLELIDAPLAGHWLSLTPRVPSAAWYERAVADLFGAVPDGYPRLEPLLVVAPRTEGGSLAAPPRPGSGSLGGPRLIPSEEALGRRVVGEGVFTIPHGPVRSGVTESLEFLVESPGEDISRMQLRVFAKHRGVEVAFESRSDSQQGVLVAERVEGTASVAHALAYCQALESLGSAEVSLPAQLVRALHAELERVAGHLDVVVRLCEAAALSVAQARFAYHKERIQRLRHDLCGNRFGRGVVVPGGVNPPDQSQLRPGLALRVAGIRDAIVRDRDALMVTSSFLDRLRGTGVLTSERAAEAGVVGPVGRASGHDRDVRRDHPYGPYAELSLGDPAISRAGDVQARLEVRWHEVEESFGLIGQALSILERVVELAEGTVDWVVDVAALDGRGVSSVEGPQGEIVYVTVVDQGRLRRVWPRTASFHNLPVFPDTFHTDILTDFPFIEASFAISNAGVVL